MLVLALVRFGLTYSVINFLTAKERVRRALQPTNLSFLSKEWLTAILFLLIAVQVIMNVFAVQAVAVAPSGDVPWPRRAMRRRPGPLLVRRLQRSARLS